MNSFKTLCAALVVAATLAIVPAANAAAPPVVNFLASGSSAMWQGMALSAYNDLASVNGTAHHYTVKGACTGTPGPNCAQLFDGRSSSIPLEGGNLWVVWEDDANGNATQIWAYLSVDSVVGNRAFFATPRVALQINNQAESLAGQNLIAAILFNDNSPDASALPADVYSALLNHPVTAAATDIRPEDAKFAQSRIVTALNTSTYKGLGYGTSSTQLIGTPVQSSVSSAVANPIAFNLKGKDPFNVSFTVPKYTTIPVGAAPIVFIVNRKNASGLGAVNGSGVPIIQNIATVPNLQSLYNGTECDTKIFGAAGAPDVPVTVFQREPLSGTYNTAEFTNFRIYNGGTKVPTNSQEKGVGTPTPGSVNNPLNKACAVVTGVAGTRRRAVGTGDLVNNGVFAVTDSVGYTFFSFGNVSKLAGTPSYGYITVDGVDPIFTNYAAGDLNQLGNGELPTCNAPCPASSIWANGVSFPHLRDGSYRSWSLLRIVTDATGVNLTNAKALIAATQKDINSSVPDFVPFTTPNNSDGLDVYRSHYLQSGIKGVNGPLVSNPSGNTLGGGTEAGGDVGGCIEVNPTSTPGVLNCHQ